MGQKVTWTNLYTDEKTGEVVRMESSSTATIYHKREQDYVKLYLDALIRIAKLPQIQFSLLCAMLERTSYANSRDGMTVTLSSGIKQDIANEMGWQNTRTVDNALTRLIQAGIVRREDRARYGLNPWIIGKGDWIDILKLRESYPKD